MLRKRAAPAAAADAAGCGARGRAAGHAAGPTAYILVISGPNAGGKSVCLKTTGIVQYMFQCGFLVPASENSELPVFRNLIIDIGDEQSIDDDLSTYSSHLLNMKHMLAGASGRTLVLIDEFGSGTEPIGGAIAESILERLLQPRRATALLRPTMPISSIMRRTPRESPTEP